MNLNYYGPSVLKQLASVARDLERRTLVFIKDKLHVDIHV